MFDGDLLSERARVTPDRTALIYVESGYPEAPALLERLQDHRQLGPARGRRQSDLHAALSRRRTGGILHPDLLRRRHDRAPQVVRRLHCLENHSARALHSAPEFESADLSHVRWFISGGAPLPRFLIDQYQARGVVFKQGYGMTEVGVNCFTMTVDDSYAKPGSNNDAATRAAYADDGWFRTGDLARCDADGYFYIAGRIKEMFISGGVNIYPAEIEAELAIVGNVPPAELEQYLVQRIAKYKVPRRFVFLDALPRTPYGKVVKDELRKALA